MRYRENKHDESESRHSSLFVLSFLCVFLCAAALGTLRLYGLYLENRISETAARIEACKEENLVLSRRYAQLLSPAKIYNYARCKLGMNNAENIKVIRLNEGSLKLALNKGNGAGNSGVAENTNPFVKIAHAKD